MTPAGLLVVSLVISGLFMTALGFYGWRSRNRIPVALPYALLMWAAAWWAFLYAFELASGSLLGKVLLHDLRFLALPYIPFLELWLVLTLVGMAAWLRKARAAILLAIPVLAMVLALTSTYHTLFRFNFSVSTAGPVPVLQFSEGTFVLVYQLYSLVLLLAAYTALLYGSRKQGTLLSAQTLLLLVALGFPTVINYLFVAGITPVPGINLTAPLLWAAAILYTVAIFQYRFLDVVPLARNQVIETMGTPMIVLDTAGRIIDHNQAAAALFPVPGDGLRGRLIGDAARNWPEFLAMCQAGEKGSFHLARSGEGGVHTYLGSADLLSTPAGEAAGRILILQDVTDLEKARDDLHESERKYQNLYRYAEVGLFETSLAGETVIACNQMYADLAGFNSPEDATGQDVRSLYVNPEERDLMIGQLRKTGKVDNVVAQFRNRKTGGVFTGQFSARWDRKRDVAEGTIIDITRQREVEEQVRDSETRYREFFTTSRDAVFITTVGGQWIDFNDSALEIFGYDDRADLMALPLTGLYERSEDRSEIIRRLREEMYIRDYPVRLRKKDGSVIDALVTAAVLRGPDGAIKALIGSIRDVTAHKAMEKALRESEGRLQAIIEGSPIPKFVIDHKHRVISWNRAIEELTGISANGMVGTDGQWRAFYTDMRPVLADLLVDGDFNRIASLYAGKFQRSALIEGAFEVTDFFPKLGTAGKWLYFTAAPIRDGQGTLIGAVETLEDITARKHAEEAIHEANTYLNNLIDYANTPIIVWDPSFRITRFNHAFERLTGRTEQEVLGQELEILFPAESIAISLDLIKKTLAGERWETVEIPILTVEGETRTVLWNSANITGPDGMIISTIAQGTDITERKRAEEALRESNAYLNNLIDYANVPMIVWDPSYRITRFNHAFERLTGWLSAQVIGRDVALLFPSGTREQSMAYLLMAMSGEWLDTIEIPILRTDGNVRTVLWNSAPIYASDGASVIATIAQGQDITERDLALKALQTSEEQFRLSFEQASVGMSLTAPDGRLLKVNRAFCEMLGSKEEELQRKGFAEITYPEDLAESVECVRSLIAGERDSYRLVKRYLHRDGSTVWADVSTILLRDQQGNPLHFVTHIMNITERVAAEHQREALIRELEQKNAELERFTYTVSHDLKSPLITIKGFLGLLREDALKGDQRQVEHDIGRITAAAETMQALLSDLLSLSQVGRVINPPERVNFGTIAEEAMEVLAGTIAENGVTVCIAHGLPDVIVDQPRIREVLINLLENAIKFRGDAPGALVEIGATDHGGESVFFVRDNGIGIDSRYQGRIFNLFEKLDPKSDGTGIGLSIVRRIIEVHGGRIWAESSGPGQGTTFFFTLPLAGGPAP